MKQTKATSVSVAFVSKGTMCGARGSAGSTRLGKAVFDDHVWSRIGQQDRDGDRGDAVGGRGQVSLDAPVVRYIPDFTMASPRYRQITVRMLLNHSAGLGGTDYGDWLSDKPIPGYTDRVLAGLRTSRLKTTPGAMNVYCNDCFTLAGLVVERVAGMPFHDYVSKNIFRPLAMKHSMYPTSTPKPGVVAPVIQAGRSSPPDPQRLGGRGMFSTPTTWPGWP